MFRHLLAVASLAAFAFVVGPAASSGLGLSGMGAEAAQKAKPMKKKRNAMRNKANYTYTPPNRGYNYTSSDRAKGYY